jgi:hypothetical protein
MLLYFAADLIWATKIKAIAEDLGVAARPVRNVDMLRARLADSPVRAALIDLDNAEAALSIIDALHAARTAAAPETPLRSIRIVAFGPHVLKDLFQTARNHGCDEVLTRGALEHNLPEIVMNLAST